MYRYARMEYIVMLLTSFAGAKLTYSHQSTTLTIDWSDVFAIDLIHGHVIYQLYIGTEEAAADYVLGIETAETTFSITSPKLKV